MLRNCWKLFSCMLACPLLLMRLIDKCTMTSHDRLHCTHLHSFLLFSLHFFPLLYFPLLFSFLLYSSLFPAFFFSPSQVVEKIRKNSVYADMIIIGCTSYAQEASKYFLEVRTAASIEWKWNESKWLNWYEMTEWNEMIWIDWYDWNACVRNSPIICHAASSRWLF